MSVVGTLQTNSKPIWKNRKAFRIACYSLLLVISLRLPSPCHDAIVTRPDPSKTSVSISNNFLGLTFTQSQNRLAAGRLLNHLTKQSLDLSLSDGFCFYLGPPDPLAEKTRLTLSEFVLKRWNRTGNSITFDLEHEKKEIGCVWHWTLSPKDSFARSWLEVKNLGRGTLSLADLDVLVLRYRASDQNGVADALQTMVEADSETTTSVPQTSAWHAIDGDPTTSWVSQRTSSFHWLTLSFARPIEVGYLALTVDPVKSSQVDHFDLQTLAENGEWKSVASLERTGSESLTLRPGQPITTKRLRILARSSDSRADQHTSATITEVEVFDSQNRLLRFETEAEIPQRRSVTYGDGEGVAITERGSVFAALEALLYDYRMGVARDGSGFRLGHNPGWVIKPNETRTSKTAVIGVAREGEAGSGFVRNYLTPAWIQTKQGDPQWDRYWAYNITADTDWSLGTDEMIALAKALAKAREAYGFGFRHVGPDITAFVTYDPFRLGLNPQVFPGGFDKVSRAIESIGSKVEGYYGIGRVEDVQSARAREAYRKTLLDLIERYHFKMVIFDAFVGGLGGYQVYLREQVWDNFRETIEAARARLPGLMIGLESFSPNLVSRWLWVNTQFDHHPTHYRKYNPDIELNNVRAELIPDAGAGAAPVLHGRDVVTASSGVYDLLGTPWRGVETFGPLWQLIYNPFYQGASAMERAKDNWVLNLFGAATVISPITYGRIFGQPPEDFAWLGKMLKLRDTNLDLFKENQSKENGDIFHCKADRGFAVFRHLKWEANKEKSFSLDESVGLRARRNDFLIRQIYPTERILTKSDGEFLWRFGETVRIQMNPFELRLISIQTQSSLNEEVIIGCDYDRDPQGNIVLLGMPGEKYQVRSLTRSGPQGVRTIAFEGAKNPNPWYQRLLALSPDKERKSRIQELCDRVDFVKATGYPAAWRESNLYSLPEFHRKYPYPYPEIEAVREIKMGRVYASHRWFCDGDLSTPPPIVPVGIVHAPLVIGSGSLQVDLGRVVNLSRIRVAVKEKPTKVEIGLSSEGKVWTNVRLNPNERFWDTDKQTLKARYLRLESADLTVQEFQVFEGSSSDKVPLDYSKISPYPISFVRSLTKPEDISHAWRARASLPSQLYNGQEIAVPVWLKEEAFPSEVWLLYRIDGKDRSEYRIVPGYSKEADRTWNLSKVKGLTFKIPLMPSDAGKELDLTLVSSRSIDHSEAWLVSDPLPYVRKLAIP